ncbi:hypothetical protein ACTFIW_005498 [Dictyostelium discoideum]
MFIQPQKDNGLTCQTSFQAKSRKRVLEPTPSHHPLSFCDNILNAQKYYNKGRGDVILVGREKVLVKRKFLQNNLSKDLISHKLGSKNCGTFITTANNANNISMPERDVMDERSYEVESFLNHDKVKNVKLKDYPELEKIEKVDTVKI